MLSFTIGRSSISVFLDGVFNSIDDSHVNYTPLLDQLRVAAADRDLDAIRGLVTIKAMIERLTVGRVTITDAEVLFEGSPVGNYLAERMLEIMNSGIDIEPYAAFMNNVMDNPADYVHHELYQWMEKGRLPITPDGHLLAFKKVRADYTDCHTGKFDNSLGNVIEMDRKLCDTNRHNHCSSGFHFASTGYLKSFGGQRVLVVKINPRDVTSIPSDYKFTKGRCCRYEVVAELTEQSAAFHDCWKKGVVVLENPSEFPADVLAKIALPSPALNEPVTVVAESDPLDDTVEMTVATYTGPWGHGQNLVTTAEDLSALSPFQRLTLANEAIRKANGAMPSAQPVITNVQIKKIETGESAEFAAERYNSGIADEAEEACAAIEADMTDADSASLKEAPAVFTTTDNREFTIAMLKQALSDASIRGAARNLGIGDSTLRGWMKKANLS